MRKKIKKNINILIIEKMQSMNTLFSEIPVKRTLLTWPAAYKRGVLDWLRLLEQFIASSFHDPAELPDPPRLLKWREYHTEIILGGIEGALQLLDLSPPTAEAVDSWHPYQRSLSILWFASFAALVGRADTELKSQVTEAWIPKFIRDDLPAANAALENTDMTKADSAETNFSKKALI